MNRLAKAVVLMAFLASTSLSCSAGGDSPGAAEPTALVADSFPPCRQDVLAHVHEPDRLQVVDSCFSASGAVKEKSFETEDGDYKILVELDPQYSGILAPTNKGLMVVEVIPFDQPSVFIPEVGQHATFYGAMVLDKPNGAWVEIHPAWLITTLDVAVTAPASVPVGDELRVSIAVNSTRQGEAKPASEVNIFLELIADSGSTVRYEATKTNTTGVATLGLAALEGAGDYKLRVYASKGYESGFGELQFTIKRT